VCDTARGVPVRHYSGHAVLLRVGCQIRTLAGGRSVSEKSQTTHISRKNPFEIIRQHTEYFVSSTSNDVDPSSVSGETELNAYM